MRLTPRIGCLLSGFFIVLLGNLGTAAGPKFQAVDHVHKTIYHSPQTPGYTCWAGAWTMPDGSLMTCFTQATGPIKGRSRAPKEVQHQLTWPPTGHSFDYDMTG